MRTKVLDWIVADAEISCVTWQKSWNFLQRILGYLSQRMCLLRGAALVYCKESYEAVVL